MSGMKFRRTCSVCNATFFSPDRKAAYCLKCMKKRVVKHVPSEVKAPAVVTRVAPRPAPPQAQAHPLPEPGKLKSPRAPKAGVLTPELRLRIMETYNHEYANRPVQTRDVHTQIANKFWVKRQLVAE